MQIFFDLGAPSFVKNSQYDDFIDIFILDAVSAVNVYESCSINITFGE